MLSDFCQVLIIRLALLFVMLSTPLVKAEPKIITDDVPRFWQAWDVSGPEINPDAFEQHYLKPGTPGLKDFIQGRIISADNLSQTIRAHRHYYASLRQSSQRLDALKPEIRKILDTFASWYPDAILPDVYIVIGAMNSGGTASRNGLLIGLDMYGRHDDMPEHELGEWHRQVLKPIAAIPAIVAHEMIHFQQASFEDRSLLAQSLREGIADFIGERLAGVTINEHLKAFAEPREQILWQEFKTVMLTKNYQGWLYGGNGTKQRPQDLGYWVGYRIANAYYHRHSEKQQAISDMLQMTDAKAFLEKSGYEGNSPSPTVKEK